MIRMTVDSKGTFRKEMDNLVKYSFGFLEGVERGKKIFLQKIGESTIEVLNSFIDSMARQNPSMLHHVYEWEQTGMPNGRLFDINYTVSNIGLSLKSTFRQSLSIKAGSKVPFYNKAAVMENGISVTVRPRNSDVLVFEDNGETVFTRNPVRIESPGGPDTQGGFERAFDSFIKNYFSQSFLRISGINEKFGNMNTYKQSLQAGIKLGKSAGVAAGFKWITNLGAA